MVQKFFEEGLEVTFSYFRHIWGFGQGYIHFPLLHIFAKRTLPFWSG